MIKEFNSLEEIQKYYDQETNTYVFKENGECIDIKFNFDLNVNANIDARDIIAWSINTHDVYACNISYYALCYAYNNIKCKSIEGRRKNGKHFVLDGKLEVEEDE